MLSAVDVFGFLIFDLTSAYSYFSMKCYLWANKVPDELSKTVGTRCAFGSVTSVRSSTLVSKIRNEPADMAIVRRNSILEVLMC